jgi:hypothetical protein
VLVFGAIAQAAGIDRAIADAESRRRGAESSLREILAKPPANLDEARKAYSSAAASQNAWLDLVLQAVDQRSVTPPDVSAASQAATAAVMEWVAVGGRALGLPPLTSSLEKGLRKSVEQDLNAIAKETWKSYAAADGPKRDPAIASLSGRLRWKTLEELQAN